VGEYSCAQYNECAATLQAPPAWTDWLPARCAPAPAQGAPAKTFQHKTRIFDRPSALSLDGFRGSGADFMPEFEQFIETARPSSPRRTSCMVRSRTT
jgi:hypothetical protein